MENVLFCSAFVLRHLAKLFNLAILFSILFMMLHINSPFHLTAHQRALNPFSLEMNAKNEKHTTDDLFKVADGVICIYSISIRRI